MSAVTIPRPPATADWLALRHGYANASDAAAYVGRHPYKTLTDIAVEKLAPVGEEISSRAIDRGNRLEGPVADWWADDHGLAVYEPDVLYRNGRILATLDRRIAGVEREALEVKTTRHEVHEVSEHWWWQGQAQMLCADLDRVHFAVLDGSMDLRSYTVERDDQAIAGLVDAVDKAWGFIDLGMMPEGVELTADHLARLYPSPTPGTYIDLDDDGMQAVLAWEQLRRQRVDLEKAEKEMRDLVAAMIADAEGARYDGRLIATWKGSARTSLDTKRLTAELPDVVAQYQREISVRTLRATKELGA